MAYDFQRGFRTKDKDIQRYMDLLVKDHSVILPPRVAQDIGRNKTIRILREIDRKNPCIVIGHDRRCNVSIIKTKGNLKIIRIGDKYVFSL